MTLLGADPAEIRLRWKITSEVACKLVEAAGRFALRFPEREVKIISGYRTQAEQNELRRRGRPAALDDLSTHRTCPATGADITLGPFATREMKRLWGQAVTESGLRWGGGSAPDEEGIPIDWQHVDAGPRAR